MISGLVTVFSTLIVLYFSVKSYIDGNEEHRHLLMMFVLTYTICIGVGLFIVKIAFTNGIIEWIMLNNPKAFYIPLFVSLANIMVMMFARMFYKHCKYAN